jgi:hypothetical protein
MEFGDTVQCSGDHRCSAVAAGGSGASRRSHLPLIGGQGGGARGTDSHGTIPRGLHLPYMVLCDGGPQPQWVGSPDQGAESRAQLAHPLGQLVEINSNILPLDLTLCFLTFDWHPLHHK